MNELCRIMLCGRPECNTLALGYLYLKVAQGSRIYADAIHNSY